MAKILGCKHKIIKNAGHISNQEQPEIVTNILFIFSCVGFYMWLKRNQCDQCQNSI